MPRPNLATAQRNKKDEFYTRYEDIEQELSHYNLNGKKVYCNCDDYNKSNFVKFFHDKFDILGIKTITSTSLNGYVYMYDGIVETINPLRDGDFRSEECITILKDSDIVITNPPFSIYKEFILQCVEYNKDFIFLGNNNSISYPKIFPLYQNGLLHYGYTANKTMTFDSPYEGKGKGIEVPAISWFTSLRTETNKRLKLTKSIKDMSYPTYYNFDAINIDKLKDIPYDYYDLMGVPITYLIYHDPQQFEIVGLGANKFGIEIGVRLPDPEHSQYRKDINKSMGNGDVYLIDEYGHPDVKYCRVIIKRIK